jgi:hypothetical protein
MSRLTAIFLIVVHLVNLVGGYTMFIHMERDNSRKLSAQLDNDEYAGREAITIKIPYSLPYSNHPEHYERVDGSFEHDGQIYRLVKQKLFNDTLYVVCVKDAKGTEIRNDFKGYVSTFTNHASDSKSESKSLLQLTKDFEPPMIVAVVPGEFLEYSIGVSGYYLFGLSRPQLVVDHPPKA